MCVCINLFEITGNILLLRTNVSRKYMNPTLPVGERDTHTHIHNYI